MGQYYSIINVDKQQQLLPFDYGNGLKLMEWAYDKNCMVLTLMNLLANEWKGDRVYVLGDYADLENPDEVWAGTLAKLNQEFATDDLYEYMDVTFSRIMPDVTFCQTLPIGKDGYAEKDDMVGCTKDFGYRYIYNHATRQVIDMAKCPILNDSDGEETDDACVAKIAPLPLLLAMGNGRGGGDYFNKYNAHLVGSWCETSVSIEVTKEPLETAADYEAFAPGFIR